MTLRRVTNISRLLLALIYSMASGMSRTKDFIKGFACLFRGFGFLAANPRLWLWAIVPTLINFILFCVMIAVFIHYYGAVYGWLSAHLGHIGIENAGTWYLHVLNALLWTLNALFQLLIILLSLMILLIISYALGLIIAAPFNDALSERVEILVTGIEPPEFSWKKFLGDLVRTIRIEAIKAGILILIPIVLFILSFIPVIGGGLYVIATFFFGAWDLGFTFADLPMGRRVLPFKDRVAFAKTNKWSLIGLGSGFVIPFFALLFNAPMVVGGTLLYLKKATETQRKIPPTPL